MVEKIKELLVGGGLIILIISLPCIMIIYASRDRFQYGLLVRDECHKGQDDGRKVVAWIDREDRNGGSTIAIEFKIACVSEWQVDSTVAEMRAWGRRRVREERQRNDSLNPPAWWQLW